MDQTDSPQPLPADHAPALTAPDAQTAVADLARRWQRANGPMISALNRVGGTLESQLALIPDSYRDRIETVTAAALERAYGIAGPGDRLPETGGRLTLAASLLTGAAGGTGGLPTALAELPFTVTLLLHAIRREAKRAGYDPDDPWIRAEALRCFASGSPAARDDGIDTSFFSARIALTGPAIQRLIATIAPKLAATLSQKLAAQAVPVLGAVTGATLNAAFLRYYREMAAIRFALLRLAETHGAAPVLTAFRQAVEAPKITRA